MLCIEGEKEEQEEKTEEEGEEEGMQFQDHFISLDGEMRDGM